MENNIIIHDEEEKGNLQTVLEGGGDDLASTPVQKGVDEANSKKLSDEITIDGFSLGQKKEISALLESSSKELQEKVKAEGQEVKKDFLTFFGLFASFVTFLSIEIQIFKNKDNIWELIGITSISFSFVMFFAVVINDIAKDKSSFKDFLKPTYIINIIFAIIGILCLSHGGKISENKIDSMVNRMNSYEKRILFDSLELVSLKNENIQVQRNFDSLHSKIDTLNTLNLMNAKDSDTSK